MTARNRVSVLMAAASWVWLAGTADAQTAPEPPDGAIEALASDDSGPLIAFAQAGDAERRARAAHVLALENLYEEALALIGDQAERSYPACIGRAHWALHAADWPRAMAEARCAMDQAPAGEPGSEDRRYAIALLVEAHRSAGDLDALLQPPAQAEPPEMREMRLDLLRDQGRNEDAARIVQAVPEAERTEDDERQLVLALEATGQDSALIAEFRRRIEDEPLAVRWRARLAERYLISGDAAAAESAWREWLALARDDAGAAIEAAPTLRAMGFGGLAAEALDDAARRAANPAPLLFALADLHIASGPDDRAIAALERLDAVLPAAYGERGEIAAAYARLGRPESALKVWTKLEAASGGLDANQRMKLAALQEETGDTAGAFETWRQIRASGEAAAQAPLITDRLLSLGRDSGELTGFGEALQSRIESGAGRPDDLVLLVRLKAELGERDEAEALARSLLEDDGAEEARRLTAARDAYRALGDRDNENLVLRRLIDADPEGAAMHLRALILNLTARRGAAEADLAPLIARLRELEPGVSGDSFEAGIYARAGLAEPAERAWRRAIEQDPSQGDNYLLLSGLLAANDRGAESVAMLQELAETAETQELFSAAIDGLVNLAAPQLGQKPGDAQRAVLEWARNTVLQRIAADGGSSLLHQVLEDVTGELGDTDAHLAVIETGLAQPADIRAATLRQLITVTDPNVTLTSFLGGVAAPSVERNIAYARRLIALRRILPPDVYVNAGQALLGQGDPTSAATAFDAAVEITGRRDVHEQAADIFASAGYDGLARLRYERARISDRDNIELGLKLAGVYERDGQRADAHALYADILAMALKDLPLAAARAPASSPAPVRPVALGAGPQTFEASYGPAMAGYLRTWPADEAGQNASAADFEALLAELLAGAQGDTADSAPRLEQTAEMLRRTGLATGRAEIADRTDAAVMARFPADDAYALAAARTRRDWGDANAARALADGAGVSLAPENDAVALRRAVNMALLGGDGDALLDALKTWAASGAYVQAFAWSEGKLGPDQAAAFADFVIDLARNDPEFADTLTSDPMGVVAAFAQQAETLSGRRLYSAAELMEVVRAALADGRSPFGMVGYFANDASIADAQSVMESAAASQRGQAAGFAHSLWAEMMRKPMTPEQADALAAPVIRLIAEDPSLDGAAQRGLPIRIPSDLDPVHRDALRRANQALLDQTGGPDYVAPLLAFKAGDFVGAADALADAVGASDGVIMLGSEFIAAFVAADGPAADAVLARLDDRIAEGDQAALDAKLTLQIGGANPGWRSGFSLAKQGLERFGDTADGLTTLVQITDEQDWPIARADALARLYALQPDEIVYRALLFNALMEEGDALGAYALTDRGQRDLQSEAFQQEVLSQTASRDFQSLRTLLPAGQTSSPSAAMGALGIPGFGSLQSAVERAEGLDAVLKNGDGDAVPKAMRALWQAASDNQQPEDVLRIQAPTGDGNPVGAMIAAISRLAGAGEGPSLYRRAAARPEAAGEFADYLRSLTVVQSGTTPSIYEYYALALAAAGDAEAMADRLARAARNDSLNRPQRTLLMALLQAQAAGGANPAPAEAELLDLLAGPSADLSEVELIQAARMLAAYGRQDEAEARYREFAAAYFFVAPPGRPALESRQPAMTVRQVVDDAAERLDQEHARSLIADVLELVAPPVGVDSAAYQNTVVSAWSRVASGGDALDRIAAVLGDDADLWSPHIAPAIGALQREAGQDDAVLDSLRRAVARPPVVPIGADQQEDMRRRQAESQLQILLGGSVNFVSGPERAASIAEMLPQADQIDDGRRDWMVRAADMLDQRADEPDADIDLVVPLMAEIAKRMAEAGYRDAAAPILDRLYRRIEAMLFPAEAITQVRAAAEAADYPISLAAERALLAAGAVTVDQAAETIDRIAAEASPAEALEIGEAVALTVKNRALMTSLAEAARAAGRPDRVSWWEDRLTSLDAAERALAQPD